MLVGEEQRYGSQSELLVFFHFVLSCIYQFDELACQGEVCARRGDDLQHVLVEASAYYTTVVVGWWLIKENYCFPSNAKRPRNIYIYVRVTLTLFAVDVHNENAPR